jgi:hypothetical protein
MEALNQGCGRAVLPIEDTIEEICETREDQ